jgi:hypothetical protein
MIEKGTDVRYLGKTYEVKDVRKLHLMTLVGLELKKDKLTHIWIGEVVKI